MTQEHRDPESSHGGIWAEYRFHVLNQLERLGKDQEKSRNEYLTAAARAHEEYLKEFARANERLGKVQEQVFQLRLRAAFWGGVAGALGYLVSFLFDKVFHK